LADELLACARGVCVRSIDEVHAALERGVRDGDGVLLVRAAPEHHRAQAQRADFDARATEVAVLHAITPSTVPALPQRGPPGTPQVRPCRLTARHPWLAVPRRTPLRHRRDYIDVRLAVADEVAFADRDAVVAQNRVRRRVVEVEVRDHE